MVLPPKEKINRALIVEKGYVDTISLNPEDIYIPKEVKGTGNNVTRLFLDESNIQSLQQALQSPDWSLPLIVIKRIPGGLTIAGKTYRYQLVAGYHRLTAILRNHEPMWVFDLYEFDNEEEELDFQAIENDHAPRKPIDLNGLVNYLSYKVNKGMIDNDKQQMAMQLEKFKNVHHKTKSSAVNRAASKHGAYTDVAIRDFNEIKQFMGHAENYDPNQIAEEGMYTHSGKIDPNRDQHGWTVKEGYEYEYVMNAIKSFNETGKTSYFVNHVKEPTENKSLQDRRDEMMETYAALDNALIKTFEYYKKHGTLPWKSAAFFPQNNVLGQEENTFIKV